MLKGDPTPWNDAKQTIQSFAKKKIQLHTEKKGSTQCTKAIVCDSREPTQDLQDVFGHPKGFQVSFIATLLQFGEGGVLFLCSSETEAKMVEKGLSKQRDK